MDENDKDYRRPRGRVGKRVLTAVILLMFAAAVFERFVLGGNARPF
jgi:hypothetical protein